jgi:methylmalonyl-CoA/ethylmalonyl-CoA epimerase
MIALSVYEQVKNMGNVLSRYAVGIDHLAIAVRDLEVSLSWYTEVLGFTLRERRETKGKTSGMVSAVIDAGAISLVLLQGTNSESQVSMFIEEYGPGVQHVAVKVSDIEAAVTELKEAGMTFDTSIIGEGDLRQAFTRRDPQSGLMLEIIERKKEGFADNNVSELFRQLEENKTF